MRPLLVFLAVAVAVVALPTHSLADGFSVQLTNPPAGSTVLGTEEVDAAIRER